MRDFTIKGAVVLVQHPRDPGLFLGVTRRYDSNDWGLPGGKILPDEHPAAAAVRETYEETGIHVSLRENPIYVGPANNGYCAAYLANGFVGEPTKGDAGDVAWVTKEQILKGTFGSFQERLFGALDKDPSTETAEATIPKKHRK